MTGGDSSEREVSLRSAEQVIHALQENTHTATSFDLQKGYDELSVIIPQFDVVFPVIHGEEGEGGRLHKFLSQFDRKIVGTRNYEALQNAWYKIPFKKFCEKEGITTPRWEEVHSVDDILSFGFPCVLKASSGGSSKEVVLIYSEKDVERSDVEELLSSGDELYGEEMIQGVEVTVGILNGEALPLIEIVPPEGRWFDYENKYSGSTSEIPFAPSLREDLQQLIQKIALSIHTKLDVGSYSRIDFMVKNTTPYVLEINTIPGLTSGSLLPKAAEAAGMTFPHMIEILVQSAQ